MIEWQGPAPSTERLAPYARLYRRALLLSLFIFAVISVMNIGSWAIWKANATVLPYPVFVTWVFFYLALLQLLLDPPNPPPEPGKLGILGIGAVNLPVAYLTTIALQTPVLFVQVTIAKLISSALP